MQRWAIVALLTIACAGQQDTSASTELSAGTAPVLVPGALSSGPVDSTATINGASLYHPRDGAHWVIATTSSDAIVIVDGATGGRIRKVGVSGPGMGELRGPAGVVVLGDSVVLVVERDNARVQGFHLPDFTTIGTFGDRVFERPSAIAAHPAGNAYAVYVTDNLKSGVARVVQYRVTVGNGELIAIHWRTFGDTAGAGALHSSNSIAADAEHNRVLIADRAPDGSSIKVYNTEGRFAGRVLTASNSEMGSVALYACDNRDGYWVAVEPGDSTDSFHVIDRMSLTPAGSFAATSLRQSRGLSVDRRPDARFPAGAIFAGRADGGLAAISWRDVAAALRLRANCVTR